LRDPRAHQPTDRPTNQPHASLTAGQGAAILDAGEKEKLQTTIKMTDRDNNHHNNSAVIITENFAKVSNTFRRKFKRAKTKIKISDL
jgi:hypothetical protein